MVTGCGVCYSRERGRERGKCMFDVQRKSNNEKKTKTL